MRVTLEHREERAGLLRTKRKYFLDCTVEFSEEEKGVIRARRLENHHVTVPKGFAAVLDPTDSKRLYGLKMAIAAGVSLFGLVWTGITQGHSSGFIMFFGGGFYALYCLIRFATLRNPDLMQVPISHILKNRTFSIRSDSPTRSKAVEDKIYAAVAQMKTFIDESVEIGARRVHEL